MSATQESATDLNRQGLSFVQAGKFVEAADCFRQAVALDADFVSARINLGAALVELARFDEAIPVFEGVLGIRDDHPGAHHNLGVALRDSGKAEAALGHFREALRLKPDYPDAHNNLGIALLELGRPAEALASFMAALELKPDFGLALNNLGNAFCDLGQSKEAVAFFERAIELNPQHAEAHYNLGNVLLGLGRPVQAIECFERAIALKPSFAPALLNLGVTLSQLRRRDEAIECFTKALELDPANSLARAQRMHLLARNCDWDALAADLPLVPELGISGGIVPPFAMLAFEDEPYRHLVRAKRFASERYKVEPVTFAAPAGRPERLKIGYFSADFSEHAVMQVAAPLFEEHDRARFSIHAFSYGPATDDAMRRRLVAAFDSFTDVREMSDSEIAARARSDALDVAIDLQGYTQGTRLGIFAHRAAPVQVTHLGFPGSTGAPFMDYLVADATVIPGETRDAYAERLLILPNSYQPNGKQPIARTKWTRKKAGLPKSGFVFCCFNNSYKITPREFDIWMDLLRRVDGSLFWLVGQDGHVERNLAREAARRGVDPARLVFAPRVALEEHLARLRLADLFLDTFAYTGHATASDTLWAGLPLVTKLGRGFPARVSASLLCAVGLPELVTHSDEEYAGLAFELATDSQRLADIRRRLGALLADTPVFDPALYARHFEAACDAAFARFIAGQEPEDIVVSAEPDLRGPIGR